MKSKLTAALAMGAVLAMTSLATAGETVGPGGEKATPTSALTLTDAEVAKLKDGKFSAALLWHTSSD
ncbi:MAG: LacI family transcriptional regulator, partial [Hyphomicrobiales bacterium]|nr:LacI family transcriptional regulator [Hyphomicrobiales bacterium]